MEEQSKNHQRTIKEQSKKNSKIGKISKAVLRTSLMLFKRVQNLNLKGCSFSTEVGPFSFLQWLFFYQLFSRVCECISEVKVANWVKKEIGWKRKTCWCCISSHSGIPCGISSFHVLAPTPTAAPPLFFWQNSQYLSTLLHRTCFSHNVCLDISPWCSYFFGD